MPTVEAYRRTPPRRRSCIGSLLTKATPAPSTILARPTTLATAYPAEAMKWYRKATDQGVTAAQTALGFMYAQGQGVPQNYVEAMKWFQLAAKQGYALAQFNLGFMYAAGEGVRQNYVNAHLWFNLAAAQGDQDAAKNLDLVEQRMTPAQLDEAQRLAREWKPKAER